jgi:hypothetical protein
MATAVENFNERGASSNCRQFPLDNRPHKYLDHILEAKANMNVCDFCALVWRAWENKEADTTTTPEPGVYLRVSEDCLVHLSFRLYITRDNNEKKENSIQVEMFTTPDSMIKRPPGTRLD